MNTITYSFCEPKAMPKKRKTGAPVTFSLVSLTVLGCNLGCTASSVERHHHCKTDHTYALDILEGVSSQEPVDSHIERDKILFELERLFTELSTHGWDGYGAYPIQQAAYLNAVSLVMNTPDKILKLWNVFPAPNGTITFEFKAREVAAMSVGNAGFSFAAMKDGEDPIMDEMEFDISKASEALIRMSNLFGNYDV